MVDEVELCPCGGPAIICQITHIPDAAKLREIAAACLAEAEKLDPQPERHLLAVRITGKFLLQFVKTASPHVLSCEGIPSDAKPLRIFYDGQRDIVGVIYEHPSFPLHRTGTTVDEFSPQYTTYCGEAVHRLLQDGFLDKSPEFPRMLP